MPPRDPASAPPASASAPAAGARGLAAAVLALVGLSGCGSARPPSHARILGTWVSDREATMAWIRRHRPLEDAQLAKLEALFGTLRVTYTEREARMDMRGEVTVKPYTVLDVTRGQVATRTFDPLSGGDKVVILCLAEGDDTLSVYVDEVELREFFRRVPEREAGR